MMKYLLTFYMLLVTYICTILVDYRLIGMHCSVRYFVEPFQAALDTCKNGYNSARLAGDIDNALLSLFGYCITHLFAIPDLASFHKKIINFLQQMVC